MRVPIAIITAALLCITISPPKAAQGRSTTGPPPWGSLSVGSTTFRNNAMVPDLITNDAMGRNGKNLSPELEWWRDPGPLTKSYALTAWDADAPARGGWWHWVLFDIPPQTHRITEGQSAGTSGTTSFNSTGYGGPCPPPGRVHHYRFTVYALNVAHIGADFHTTGPELLAKMDGHVLVKGVTVGLYKR